MEIKITQEKENALFGRKEIEGHVEANSVPSRLDVIDSLAEKFGVSGDCIKIKKIAGKFGSQAFGIKANIYSSKESKESIERKKKKDGNVRAEVKTEEPAEKPVEEKNEISTEEVPKEEPKESSENKPEEESKE